MPSTVLFDYPTIDALTTYVLTAREVAHAVQAAVAKSRRSTALSSAPSVGGFSSPLMPGYVASMKSTRATRARTASFVSRPRMDITPSNLRGRTSSFGSVRMVGSSASGSGGIATTKGRHRASLFAHGQLTALPLGGSFPTPSLSMDGFRPLGGMQMIVMESMAMHLPGSRQSHQCMSAIDLLCVDAPIAVPCSRWDMDSVSKSSLPRFASFLDDSVVSRFDPGIFSIAPSEGTLMDPQQRLLLECSLEAISQSASLSSFGSTSMQPQQPDPKDKLRHSIAVYVGASYAEYLQLTAQFEGFSPYTASGGSLSVLAGRIAYVFGFMGPTGLVDTACSSSLVSLSAAHSALRLGQSQCALSGAVNLQLSSHTTSMYGAAGMLTQDGRCKTLDASADGYVRAEAASMVVLKLLSIGDPSHSLDGQQHKQNQHLSPQHSFSSSCLDAAAAIVALPAVVVNQDGRSSSLTAPNGPAQQALIHKSLQNARIQPQSVSTLHLHGTGTALGDPIEVNAALSAFVSKRNTQSRSLLAFAATKASFGHAEPAAGAVGLAAAILSLESKEQSDMLHLRTVNPYVAQCMQGNQSPSSQLHCTIPRTRSPLSLKTTGHRAITGVSAFAFQGTNAHALVEVLDLRNASIEVPIASPVSMLGNIGNTKAPAVSWNRHYCWVHPQIHPFVMFRPSPLQHYHRKGNQCIEYQAKVNSAACSSLHYSVCMQNGIISRKAISWGVAMEIAAAVASPFLVPNGSACCISNVQCGDRFIMPMQHGVWTATCSPSQGAICVFSTESQNDASSCILKGWLSILEPSRRGNDAETMDACTALPPGVCTLVQLGGERRRIKSVFASMLGDNHCGATRQSRAGSDFVHEYRIPIMIELMLQSMRCVLEGNDSNASLVPFLSSLGSLMGWQKKCQDAYLCVNHYIDGKKGTLHASTDSDLHAMDVTVKCISHNGKQRHVGMEYATQWQASLAPLMQSSTPLSISVRSSHSAWHVKDGVSNDIHAFMSDKASSSSLVHMTSALELIQHTALASLASHVTLDVLSTCHVLDHQCMLHGQRTNEPLSQQYAAMLRCALSEYAHSLEARVVFIDHHSDRLVSDADAAGIAKCNKRDERCHHGTSMHNGVTHSPRLVSILNNFVKTTASGNPCNSTWMICGGAGALGQLTANWLTQEDSIDGIVLLGRSGRFSSDNDWIASASATITVQGCDISLSDDTSNIHHHNQATCPSGITGFIHAGGILLDAPLLSQSTSHMRRIFAPKVVGAHNLLVDSPLLIPNHPVQSAVLFSSIASFTGPAGSALYAAANAVLDSKSIQLKSSGVDAVSLQWGAWSSIGMVSSSVAVQRAMERSGIGMVTPSAGLAVLCHAVGVGVRFIGMESVPSVVTAIPFKWQVFLAQHDASNIFSDFMVSDTGKRSSPLPCAVDGYTKRYQGSNSSALSPPPPPKMASISRDDVLAAVDECIIAIHGSAINHTQPLIAAGLDSLGAVELKNHLQQAFSTIQLPATLIFDYPTVKNLVEFISSLHRQGQENAKVEYLSMQTISESSIQQTIVEVLCKVTGIDSTRSSIYENAPLHSFGLDSLSAVELCHELNCQFVGLNILPTAVFDYPTLKSLASFISSQLSSSAFKEHGDCGNTLCDDAMGRLVQPQKNLSAAVAITSIIHRLASPYASDYQWTSKHKEYPFGVVDAVSAVPYMRWDVDSNVRAVSHKPGSRFGFFLDNIAHFDAAFFSIAPSEAVLIDPQQRMMLEVSFFLL